MGNAVGALLVSLSVSLGQVTSDIGQEDREFQGQVFQQWWGDECVWKFDELPLEGKVAEKRVPYSGYIYPDTAGGTMSMLRKYDQAFNGGRLLATAHERADTSIRETVTRPVTYTQRFGLFGGQVHTYTVMERVTATPAWYGHCNGWTSAAIRHAEPLKEVRHNGVVFTPADIKGLLAEIYMYNDPQMLAGDGTWINPGVFHVIMTNWLGKGSHPIGMEADPRKEKWNYPIYAYSAQTAQNSPQYVDVAMNVTYAMSSRGEFQASPRIPRIKYFHYRLQLDDDGAIVGGWYYNDSSRIDMLWVPLRPKPSGKEGNERGNPYIDVDEVVAIWRKSVPDSVRRNWVIIDPPNRAPVITVAKASDIAENQTQVLQVTAHDEDLNERLNFVAPQQLVFSISGGADRGAFEIDPETGELSFSRAADFEQPVDVNEDNVYEVKVSVEDGAGEGAAQLLSINVTDTNDAPAITSDRVSKTLENQLAVMAVTFEDQDQPTQTLTCSLSGGADMETFSLDSKTGKLSFKQAPDFEKPTDTDQNNVYEIEINVKDSEGETTSQLVSVTVTNANDSPIIASDSTQKAAENQLSVLTVERTDEDLPKQALLCSLSGGEDREMFSIDSKTGELTFNTSPDFEQPTDADEDNTYEVEVSVSDGGGGTAKQLVNVTVTNANDAPVITSDDAPKLVENELSVLVVAHRDEDLPRQAVTCSLLGGEDLKMFAINAKTGELTFKEAPDFEKPTDADKDGIYEVEVGVADDAGATATQLLSVRVMDANDAPFIVSNASPKAPERQTAALTVSAKDEDSPIQPLSYLVRGGEDRSSFAINSKTGELTFKQVPDFENPADKDKDNRYEIEVEVRDDAGGTAMQSLSVAVTDINDDPVITTDGTPKTVEGQLVALTVAARDEDVKPQKLAFSLGGGADGTKFTIDSKTGELTFKQKPDFENPADADQDNIYEVKVKVNDGAGGTSAETLLVTVTDVNDSPIITSNNDAKVAENQLAVLTVLHRDEDLPTQTLVCSLVGGSDHERFAINAATGEVAFKQAPDFEKPIDSDQDNVYEVEVEVDDGQGGTTVQPIHVTVIDINERPTITYSPKVQENQTDVLTVNVNDEDMSMQNITISLSDGADRDLFSIDPKTGDLAFKKAPDFEKPTDADKNNIYEIEVRVEDGDVFILQSIRVNVTDADETPVAAAAQEVQDNVPEVESKVGEPAAQPK